MCVRMCVCVRVCPCLAAKIQIPGPGELFEFDGHSICVPDSWPDEQQGHGRGVYLAPALTQVCVCVYVMCVCVCVCVCVCDSGKPITHCTYAHTASGAVLMTVICVLHGHTVPHSAVV